MIIFHCVLTSFSCSLWRSDYLYLLPFQIMLSVLNFKIFILFIFLQKTQRKNILSVLWLYSVVFATRSKTKAKFYPLQKPQKTLHTETNIKEFKLNYMLTLSFISFTIMVKFFSKSLLQFFPSHIIKKGKETSISMPYL